MLWKECHAMDDRIRRRPARACWRTKEVTPAVRPFAGGKRIWPRSRQFLNHSTRLVRHPDCPAATVPQHARQSSEPDASRQTAGAS